MKKIDDVNFSLDAEAKSAVYFARGEKAQCQQDAIRRNLKDEEKFMTWPAAVIAIGCSFVLRRDDPKEFARGLVLFLAGIAVGFIVFTSNG